MRNIALEISYDGTGYSGWQIQKNAVTVQGVLQNAVSGIVKHPVTLLGSGRTDSGVHAIGQVAAFRTDSRMTPEEFKRAINASVPQDIRVNKAMEAPDEFHPRYSARQRWYRYIISTLADPVPFFRNYCHSVTYRLDVGLLNEYAVRLVGIHDFRNLACIEEDEEPVREVDIPANGFLRKMVRTIIGTFLQLEKKKKPPGAMDEILASGTRSSFVQTSYAGGLYLLKVFY
jgi:tRNA pseudouridine38-40 synthase